MELEEQKIRTNGFVKMGEGGKLSLESVGEQLKLPLYQRNI